MEFPAGEQYVTTAVSIADDRVPEPTETFRVTLEPNEADVAVIGEPSATVITIVDDDVAGGELLVNPGFEDTEGGWDVQGNVLSNNPAQAHSGSWFATFGSLVPGTTQSVSQQVSIPAGPSATLSFWLRTRISPLESTSSFRAEVEHGVDTTTLGSWTNATAPADWTLRSFDISQFAGQTVTVRFVGETFDTDATFFLLDDVHLSAP